MFKFFQAIKAAAPTSALVGAAMAIQYRVYSNLEETVRQKEQQFPGQKFYIKHRYLPMVGGCPSVEPCPADSNDSSCKSAP